jgi:hypothetical protein
MSYIVSFFAALNRPSVGPSTRHHDVHTTDEELLGLW